MEDEGEGVSCGERLTSSGEPVLLHPRSRWLSGGHILESTPGAFELLVTCRRERQQYGWRFIAM